MSSLVRTNLFGGGFYYWAVTSRITRNYILELAAVSKRIRIAGGKQIEKDDLSIKSLRKLI